MGALASREKRATKQTTLIVYRISNKGDGGGGGWVGSWVGNGW